MLTDDAGGVLAAHGGISVDTFATKAEEFLRATSHPTLGRGYLECAYAPMVELLAYLADNGFSNYIVSGGGRDFMRPITDEVYAIPSDRVIGSSTALAYKPDEPESGTVTVGFDALLVMERLLLADAPVVGAKVTLKVAL